MSKGAVLDQPPMTTDYLHLTSVSFSILVIDKDENSRWVSVVMSGDMSLHSYPFYFCIAKYNFKQVTILDHNNLITHY